MPMSFLPLESLDGKWDKSIEKLSILNPSFSRRIELNISVFVAFSWVTASDIDGGKYGVKGDIILPAVEEDKRKLIQKTRRIEYLSTLLEC